MTPQSSIETSSQGPAVISALESNSCRDGFVGVMEAQIDEKDWAKTPLGPRDAWPQTLKTILQTMLHSRFAMWMGWGPDLTFFCNDAYLPTVGVRRDWVLGSPSPKVWEEIWPVIGPRIDHVMKTGVATWDEGLMLFLERSGYSEETYHTFSYSPLHDDQGETAGFLCVVSEETERVIGERRLALLRELASALATANSRAEVLQAVRRCLEDGSHDLPFARLYLSEPDKIAPQLVLVAGASGAAAPGSNEISFWGVDQVLRENKPVILEDVGIRPAEMDVGLRSQPPHQALVVPLLQQGLARPIGAFIAGINPLRALDDAYRGFIDLFVGQIAAGFANARAHEGEKNRAEALAELNRAKTAFFSNISHELRTPLTLIVGPAEQMLSAHNGELSAENREQVDIVHRNSLRLLKLVNSLLDFSRIEADRVKARYSPTDLAALTADLAGVFRSACEGAGLKFNVICPALSMPVFVDPEMWEKIVLNLVSNAFKHTFKGEIEVGLEQQDGQVNLTVRDTGCGIPAEALPRLFERFYRVPGAEGRAHEGSGIGLALVKELAELHGGRVGVESTIDKGSTFRVTIPFGKDHLPADRVVETSSSDSDYAMADAYLQEMRHWHTPEDARVSSGRSAEPSSSATTGIRSRILLADDNADMRAYVGRILDMNWEVEAVANGREALEAARRQRPDLVLTDVMMPELDGVALVHALRSDPALADVPIIMLSARPGDESYVDGLQAGVDDYLVKPFTARELLARVESHLRIARFRHEAIDRERRLRSEAEGIAAENARLYREANEEISRRASVEKALRESEERFRVMADTVPSILFTARPDGHRDFFNRRFYELTGLPADAAEGLGWLKAFHPDDAERARQNWARSIQTGEPWISKHRLRRRDGQYRWISAKAVPIRDETNQITKWFGSATDIDEIVQAQEALRKSERRFSRFMQHLPGLAWIKDAEGRYIFANEAAQRTFGKQPDELYGYKDDEVFEKETARRYHQNDQAALESPSSIETIETIPQEDGPHFSIVSKFAIPGVEGMHTLIGGIAIDITDRLRAEAALRESEERLRLATRIGKVGVWDWDVAANRVTWSENLYEIHGLRLGEFDGTFEGFANLVHPQDLPYVRRAIDATLQTDDPYQLEFRAIRPDGKVIWIYTSASLVREEGRPIRLVGATLDITERKTAEQARARLAAVVESSADAIVSKDLNGRIRSWNAGAQEIFGYTADEVVDRSINILIPPDRIVEEEEILQRLREGDRIKHFQTIRLAKGGRAVPVSLTISPMHDEKGRIIGISSVARDITDQARIARELHDAKDQLEERVRSRTVELVQANAKFKAIWDQGIFAGLIGLDGTLLDVNRSFLEQCGFTREAVIGRPFWDTGWWNRSPAAVEWLKSGFQQALTGRPFHGESVYFLADGSERVVDFALMPIKNEHGEVGFVVPTGIDITDRREVEEERKIAEVFRESEERFRQMADHAPVLIWLHSRDGCEFVNREYLRFVGRTQEHVRGSNWQKFIHPKDLGEYLRIYQEAFERGLPFEALARFLREDGKYRWLNCVGSPRFNTDGSVLGYVGCSVDITEIKRSEDALKAAKEAAEAASQSKDRFLAILSHELRTPLTPVLMSAASMKNDPTLPPQVRDDINMIHRNVELETMLIDDLLDLSRITTGKLRLQSRPIALNEAVRSVCQICRPQIAEKSIQHQLELDPKVDMVMADPARLQQVLWNVLKNAVKFTPEGGEIRVRTSVGENGSFRVEVSDNGVGIAPENLGRIFEAFDQGDSRIAHQFGGLGLGLAISKALIELLNGSIRAESGGLGKGATFRIELPAHTAPSNDQLVKKPAPDAGQTIPLRLLVVEDHPDTARILSRMLRNIGYVVTTAHRASAALELISKEPFDLVVSDVGLPDATGYELMQKITALHPVKGIAMSGFGMDEDIKRSREAGFSDHLVKPVDIIQLDQAIRRATGLID